MMAGPSTTSVQVDSRARGDCEEEFIAYLDDEVSLGLAEVEVSSSDGGKRKRKQDSSDEIPKKKRKALNKKEKEKILLCLCDIDSNEVTTFVKAKVSNEKHISECHERKMFWESLQSCVLFLDLLCFLSEAFVGIYKSCDKGKEKFMKFQLEWHRMCSVFLLPCSKTIEESGWSSSLQLKADLIKVRQRWIGFCEGKGITESNQNAVMISVSAAVYDFYLRLLTKCQKHILESCHQVEDELNGFHEEDSVYYRFCGAALSSMLHSRYEKRVSCKPGKKDSIQREIDVLRCIKCDDKSHIPDELKYRDRGFMYFPCVEFLSFLQELDTCVMENANEHNLRRYGHQLVEVTVKQIEATQELEHKFSSLVCKRLSDKNTSGDFQAEIVSVYKELSRKLCHTRLGEFLSATQQSMAASKGKSTLAGQNLRDELLSLHVKHKSLLK